MANKFACPSLYRWPCRRYRLHDLLLLELQLSATINLCLLNSFNL